MFQICTGVVLKPVPAKSVAQRFEQPRGTKNGDGDGGRRFIERVAGVPCPDRRDIRNILMLSKIGGKERAYKRVDKKSDVDTVKRPYPDVCNRVVKDDEWFLDIISPRIGFLKYLESQRNMA